MHRVKAAFAHSSGPRTARIALVGEAWGEQEDFAGVPFIGASGQELTRMLADAGISRGECFLTNVFAFRPEGNSIDSLCCKKKELRGEYLHQPIGNGKYIREEFLPELQRLQEELEGVSPNVIVCLGAIASWAILGDTRIGSIRGAVQLDWKGRKVLPTYHPAGVLRNWAWRPIVVVDLMKAKWHSGSKELERKRRLALIRATLEEVWTWAKAPHSFLSIDIETFMGQIESISFADSSTNSICVQFIDRGKKGFSYWDSEEQEVEAWRAVKFLLSSPTPKLFQNGAFDLQWLMKEVGGMTMAVRDDTMLLHHAIYPEVSKGLGFLGSIYVDEPAWKQMVSHGEELKREE